MLDIFSNPSGGLGLICFRFQISLRWAAPWVLTNSTKGSPESLLAPAPGFFHESPDVDPGAWLQVCTAGTVEALHPMGWVLVNGKWWVLFLFSPLQDGRCWDGVHLASSGMTWRDRVHSAGQLNSGFYGPSCCPTPSPSPHSSFPGVPLLAVVCTSLCLGSAFWKTQAKTISNITFRRQVLYPVFLLHFHMSTAQPPTLVFPLRNQMF